MGGGQKPEEGLQATSLSSSWRCSWPQQTLHVFGAGPCFHACQMRTLRALPSRRVQGPCQLPQAPRLFPRPAHPESALGLTGPQPGIPAPGPRLESQSAQSPRPSQSAPPPSWAAETTPHPHGCPAAWEAGAPTLCPSASTLGRLSLLSFSFWPASASHFPPLRVSPCSLPEAGAPPLLPSQRERGPVRIAPRRHQQKEE